MTDRSILYFGDSSLSAAAGYLAGLLTHFDLGYDYVPTNEPANGQLDADRKLFVLSDYPSSMLSESEQLQIVRRVERGAGLVMIGGWQSFCGKAGQWAGTPIGDILPVHIARRDDRINCDQPALIRRVVEHPIADGLPWDKRPPVIGGFNHITPRDDSTVVLEVERYSASANDGQVVFHPIDRHPLLVVGQHGKGRTVALATDLAPHWVGGLVDWSKGPRIIAEAPESWAIEVGDYYAKFVHNLITWTARLEGKRAAQNIARAAKTH